MKKITTELAAIAWLGLVAAGHAYAQPATGGASPDAMDKSEEVPCPGEKQPAAPPPSTAPSTTAPSSGAPYYNPETTTETHAAPLWGVGMGLSVGGGVDDFVGDTMRNLTGTGGSWTARVTLGTHSFVGGEVSYIGSAQSVNRSDLTGTTTLYGNGAQAALRLNATVDYPVQPFLYGGAAWRHYSVSTSGSNIGLLNGSSDAFEVPLGIGVAGYVENVMLDVRGEYRFAWVDHMMLTNSNGSTPLVDRWGVTGNIGYSF